MVRSGWDGHKGPSRQTLRCGSELALHAREWGDTVKHLRLIPIGRNSLGPYAKNV